MSKNQTNPIKTGLIAYGYSAQTFHTPFLNTLPEFDLVSISSSQTNLIKQTLADVTIYNSAEQLICQSEAELIVITAPNQFHFPLAKLALEQGKHVVIEKPFVTNSQDGKTLIALAQTHQRILSVYQNRRWDGDFLTLKKLIKQKRLGDIRIFESHFDRLRPNVRQRWREQAGEGNGILYDLGPHLIDQCLQLFGMPTAITAHCKAMRENADNIDFFNIILHYPNMHAVLQSSPFYAATHCRFNVQGTLGHYVVNGTDPQESRLKTGTLPTSSHWSQETNANYGHLYKENQTEIMTTEHAGYETYYQKLACAINNNAETPVDALDALRNIQLIELAMQSNDELRTLEIPQ